MILRVSSSPDADAASLRVALRRPVLVAAILAAAWVATAADGQSPAPATPPSATLSAPALSPQPREIHAQQLVPVQAALVTVPGGNPEDFFAAQNLKAALIQRGILVSPAATSPADASPAAGSPATGSTATGSTATGSTDLTVDLLRDTSSRAVQLLAAHHLSLDAAMQAEGYVLLSRRDPGGQLSVSIVAHTAAGVFYGVQTLEQLIERPNGVPSLWTATIRDWPAMRYRGVHDDLSRGPFPTLAFQQHQLQVFAAHKINLYSPYFENTLEYSADPLAAPPGGSLTRAESQQLAAFAARLHILIVPEQEAFGHLHHVLEFEKYADLAETPHGHVIAPGQPGSQPLILSWFTQIAQDFPSPFLHIGADETFELGTGRTKPAVDQRGLGPVYVDFLSAIHTTLAPLDRRLLFWGDIAWSDPGAIAGLPKDMIAIPWVYSPPKDGPAGYDKDVLPFKNAGIETWVAPGDANWRVVYPLGSSALANISGFIAAGQRLGSTGELTTVWDDDGEGLFNQDWFGVLFGAAAGWQPGKSEAASYEAAFGRIFYGDATGRIDTAQQELMAAEALIDVTNKTFWVDPWSPAGLALGDKLRPNLAPARLHAERAIELIEIALANQPSLREKDALRAMELGARRIDFLALKFQLSDEMRSTYARAYALASAQPNDTAHQAEALDLLYSISSMNGRCQDLRDGYSLLKNLYRESWLAENRPYWLDNVLVRYDLRIQLWQTRGEHIDTLIDNWQATKTFPTAEQAGIPPPPQ